MSLTFNDYQSATESTANYPESGTGSVMALAYVGLGLGECGEFQGKITKILRDDNGIVTLEKAREIRKELGDVLWYVARASEELGYHLDDIAQENLDKLDDRKARGVLGGSGDNR
jgi:NTP pyrophosphatase (non-canonical NTP hydrolase)